MDISFKVENTKFNYRVRAMILSDGKILAMHDERSPYFYLCRAVEFRWEKRLNTLS
jgi:hypothetical protein